MNNVGKKTPIIDGEYLDWLNELKTRYRQSQIKAALKVNSELIQFYWSLGRDIVKMKAETKWGTGFYDSLSDDLRRTLPNQQGFSPRNLRNTKYFYELFPEGEIWQQVVSKLGLIPWGHMILIVRNAKGNQKKALFFVEKTIENNWSRAVLMNFLSTDLYEREGKAINNFAATLPASTGDLAKEITKDPYCFDFLAMREGYRESELKDALIDHIKDFLLELGTGFAYMGREYRIEVGDTEIFLDMLFYNTSIHAYVVLEVKTGDFKPGDIGQLGTYVVAVDHQLKTERDEKTVGLLICKNKSEYLAKYSLESSSQPLGISAYELSSLIPENFKDSLPTIEEIEAELNKKNRG